MTQRGACWEKFISFIPLLSEKLHSWFNVFWHKQSKTLLWLHRQESRPLNIFHSFSGQQSHCHECWDGLVFTQNKYSIECFSSDKSHSAPCHLLRIRFSPIFEALFYTKLVGIFPFKSFVWTSNSFLFHRQYEILPQLRKSHCLDWWVQSQS